MIHGYQLVALVLLVAAGLSFSIAFIETRKVYARRKVVAGIFALFGALAIILLAMLYHKVFP